MLSDVIPCSAGCRTFGSSSIGLQGSQDENSELKGCALDGTI